MFIGKSRSYEIIEYRKLIERQICTSPEIIKLLGCENEEYPEDIIPYKYSYPHEYIPGTQSETKRYINYDMRSSIDPRNNTYKNITIFFFIVCHEDVVEYKENGRTFLWYDRVVCELDNIFCEKNILGVGKTILTDNDPYYPQQKFKGRLVKFIVKDFTDGLKNGK